MRTTAVVATALALLLAGCSSPPSTVDVPDGSSPPSDTATTQATAPAGRTGWRVTATGTLGEWLPNEVCGGDYLFVWGVGLFMEESLVGLDGVESQDGPYLNIEDDPDVGWNYYWNSNKADLEAGDWVDGGNVFDFGPDASGHPPATLSLSGGWNRRAIERGEWDEQQGVDDLTLRFERIPEPDWCLEDELYYRDEEPDSEYAWHYYD